MRETFRFIRPDGREDKITTASRRRYLVVSISQLKPWTLLRTDSLERARKMHRQYPQSVLLDRRYDGARGIVTFDHNGTVYQVTTSSNRRYLIVRPAADGAVLLTADNDLETALRLKQAHAGTIVVDRLSTAVVNRPTA